MTFTFLLESALRSLTLGIIVWATLSAFRVRSPHIRSLAWTTVLLSALAMPVLMRVAGLLLSAAPPAIRIPAATSPLFLRPLPELLHSPTAGTWQPILFAVYALVAGVLLLRVCAGLVRSFRLLRESRPLDTAALGAQNVRISTRLTIPVTVGSTILVPPDWKEWNAFTQQAVIAHERAHVQRHDFFVHLIARLHKVVFWFSPLAWFLQRELIESAEAASDEEALRCVQDRVAYAGVLVEFSRNGSRFGFADIAMARGKTVGRRVERLLGNFEIGSRPSRVRKSLLMFSLLPVVCGSAGVWVLEAQTVAALLPALPMPAPVLLQGPAAAPVPAPANPVLATPQSTQFLARWIDQEVPDIASGEERDAFNALRTDEERDRFVSMFWLRRDPSPGTAANEFKDDYYRRIALANQRFGTPAGVPGWRTDRGRVLIRYGEPESIEAHPKGGTYIRDIQDGGGRVSTFPFERWRYRAIEGLGQNIVLEFVDVVGDGTYRLTYDPSEPILELKK
jgi:GWxTD domain-containing protein